MVARLSFTCCSNTRVRAFRLLRYQVRIWERWQAEHPAVDTLPAILPVVFYHGRSRWSVSRSFQTLLALPAHLLEHLLASAVVAADGPIIAAGHLRGSQHAAAAASPPAPAATADRLFDRVVGDGESFWEVVREPYLRRELSRDEAKALIRRAYDEGGRSYRGVARLFRIDGEYQKLFDFLKNHDLKVD